MTDRIKRRGLLWILPVLLAVAAAFMETAAYRQIQTSGNYIGNLYFVIGNSSSEQKIFCYTDETENVHYLFLPSYAETEDVRISFAGAKQVVFAGEKSEVALTDGESIGALACHEKYRMYFCNRKGERMAEQCLVIMRSANLPAAFLETDSGSMEMLDGDKSYEEKGRIVLFDAAGKVVCADRLNRISGRGNSTWAHPKKSYGIRLKNRTDLFGMGSADNWILLSNVEDPAYIRNKITYDMAVAAGMEGSPESQYIDLYINNTYHGMYQLCEKVEIDEQRVPIADLEEKNKRLNGDLNKCGRFETEEKKGVALVTEPDDLTGGYLLERDVPEKYWEEISGFVSESLGDLYTIKEPAHASQVQVDYISAFVNDMEKALIAEDGINPDTGKHYTEYIDLHSFAQKYILEELTKNNGAGATSSFFYKPQDAVGTKLFAGPVWDYDKAYVSLTGINESSRDLCYLMLRDTNCTTLFWRLYAHSDFREAVSDCYEDFFSDYMQEAAEEKVDEYAQEILSSIAMDQIRWKEEGSAPLDYPYELERIKTFLLERKQFLDEVWTGQGELRTVTFVSETGEERYVSVAAGETLERLPGSEPGKVSGDQMFDGWFTEDGEVFDCTVPIFEDIIVYGKSHGV